MATSQLTQIVHDLCNVSRRDAGMTDGQLLEWLPRRARGIGI